MEAIKPNEFIDVQYLRHSIDRSNNTLSFDSVPVSAAFDALNFINQAVEIEKHKRQRKGLDKFLHSLTYLWILRVVIIINLSLAYLEAPVDYGNAKVLTRIAIGIEVPILFFYLVILGLKWKLWGRKRFFRRFWNVGIFVGTIASLIGIIISLTAVPLYVRPERVVRVYFLASMTAYTRRMARLIAVTFLSILQVIIVLWVFIIIFTCLGMILFQFNVPGDTLFTDFVQSLLSMIICLSTANFPDVTIPSYNWFGLTTLFWIIYMTFILFFGMNVILAFTYRQFQSNATKELVRKYMVQRDVLLKAFYVIDEAETKAIRTDMISKETTFDIILVGNPSVKEDLFQELNQIQTNYVTALKFFQLCDKFILRKWEDWHWDEEVARKTLENMQIASIDQADEWHFEEEKRKEENFTLDRPPTAKSVKTQVDEEEEMRRSSSAYSIRKGNSQLRSMSLDRSRRLEIRRAPETYRNIIKSAWNNTLEKDQPRIYKLAKKINRHWALETFLVLIIMGNAVETILVLDIAAITVSTTLVIDNIFWIISLVEVFLRWLFLGHWSRRWNIIDSSIMLVTSIGKIVEFVLVARLGGADNLTVKLSCAFRIIRLLRILSVTKRIRRLMRIIVTMAGIIVQYAVVVFAIYYFFAIIGMSAFHGVLGYHRDELNGTNYDLGNYYNLIHFNSFWNATFTLFHLMIINNWLNTMYATMAVTSRVACLYFIIWYQSMVILFLNIAVAYIIESVNILSEKRPTTSTDNSLGIPQQQGALKMQAGITEKELEDLVNLPEKRTKLMSSTPPPSPSPGMQSVSPTKPMTIDDL
eukprot:TRINITY_DN4216_c0_g1_i6.p1 TRINITY_DN4216_c0_g1~~TRINITY_DN4216_c0_g1_i6.p1  ORF type:complete len:813 (-),score=143.28 TRINITY_DN4216_c0_g1_i6:63-2501(-)